MMTTIRKQDHAKHVFFLPGLFTEYVQGNRVVCTNEEGKKQILSKRNMSIMSKYFQTR